MNTHSNISDESFDENTTIRLERELSIITDSNRTQNQMESLSSNAQAQAQAFDQLAELLGQAVPLKTVQWSVLEKKQKELRSSGNPSWFNFKRIVTLGLSVAVLIAIGIYCFQIPVVQNPVNVNPSTVTVTEEVTDDSQYISNYWNDSFEEQLSDFEGEMICLATSSIDTLPIGEDCIDITSDTGDF